jgi:regulator of sirC expression with transglutaminase-like and TPR domain
MFDADGILKEAGEKPDSEINLFTIAIALAAPEHEGISIDRYFSHAAKIARDCGERYIALLNAGAKDDAGVRLAALKHIIADREGYEGDTKNYDDLQNADLMRVIDRRRGMPIALAILYIHAGRENGWDVQGLNFPGHFLCRIDFGGERIIFDPFANCKMMEAADLRALIKKIHGKRAELSTEYYRACSNRDILLRLQNNIKSRLIAGEEYEAALAQVERMRLFAPDDYRLLLDAGVLYAKNGERDQAVDVLEKYIMAAPDARDRRDAERLLHSIQNSIMD